MFLLVPIYVLSHCRKKEFLKNLFFFVPVESTFKVHLLQQQRHSRYALRGTSMPLQESEQNVINPYPYDRPEP